MINKAVITSKQAALSKKNKKIRVSKKVQFTLFGIIPAK